MMQRLKCVCFVREGVPSVMIQKLLIIKKAHGQLWHNSWSWDGLLECSGEQGTCCISGDWIYLAVAIDLIIIS